MCLKYMTFFKKIIKDKKAQSLIEMTVAIGIIITGVVGSLGLAVSALRASLESRNRVIAANLAREGIEVVRKIRDSNWLAGCPDESVYAVAYEWQDGGCFEWNTGLSGQAFDYTAISVFDPLTGKWSLDFEPDDFDDSSSQFYREDGVYIQSPAETPQDAQMIPFYRLITLNPICSDGQGGEEEIMGESTPCPAGKEEIIGYFINSEIKWFERGREHGLKAEDKIYNWR